MKKPSFKPENNKLDSIIKEARTRKPKQPKNPNNGKS
jgi:hypothetical protein